MPPRSVEIPPGQRRVLQAIRVYVAKHGRSPSMRDIAAALGLSATGNISRHLRALAARGVLTIAPGVHRGIVLAKEASE